ncbi:hypothetical protein DYI25_08955 [Mesobacillus boroniphilus]|uniref:Uncharacterized protein n=1 Tax=Mesobacillus boroniphilus TaxID=308892 RepID=A0A944GW25_9BACI|nr:hypothetical protein [Mesobacillus boroniphilus]
MEQLRQVQGHLAKSCQEYRGFMTGSGASGQNCQESGAIKTGSGASGQKLSRIQRIYDRFRGIGPKAVKKVEQLRQVQGHRAKSCQEYRGFMTGSGASGQKLSRKWSHYDRFRGIEPKVVKKVVVL